MAHLLSDLLPEGVGFHRHETDQGIDLIDKATGQVIAVALYSDLIMLGRLDQQAHLLELIEKWRAR